MKQNKTNTKDVSDAYRQRGFDMIKAPKEQKGYIKSEKISVDTNLRSRKGK